MNALAPAAALRVKASALPFAQMEQIGAFVRAARALGSSAEFDTADLHAARDLPRVVRALDFVRRHAARLPAALAAAAAADHSPRLVRCAALFFLFFLSLAFSHCNTNDARLAALSAFARRSRFRLLSSAWFL